MRAAQIGGDGILRDADGLVYKPGRRASAQRPAPAPVVRRAFIESPKPAARPRQAFFGEMGQAPATTDPRIRKIAEGGGTSIYRAARPVSEFDIEKACTRKKRSFYGDPEKEVYVGRFVFPSASKDPTSVYFISARPPRKGMIRLAKIVGNSIYWEDVPINPTVNDPKVVSFRRDFLVASVESELEIFSLFGIFDPVFGPGAFGGHERASTSWAYTAAMSAIQNYTDMCFLPWQVAAENRQEMAENLRSAALVSVALASESVLAASSGYDTRFVGLQGFSSISAACSEMIDYMLALYQQSTKASMVNTTNEYQKLYELCRKIGEKLDFWGALIGRAYFYSGLTSTSYPSISSFTQSLYTVTKEFLSKFDAQTQKKVAEEAGVSDKEVQYFRTALESAVRTPPDTDIGAEEVAAIYKKGGMSDLDYYIGHGIYMSLIDETDKFIVDLRRTPSVTPVSKGTAYEGLLGVKTLGKLGQIRIPPESIRYMRDYARSKVKENRDALVRDPAAVGRVLDAIRDTLPPLAKRLAEIEFRPWKEVWDLISRDDNVRRMWEETERAGGDVSDFIRALKLLEDSKDPRFDSVARASMVTRSEQLIPTLKTYFSWAKKIKSLEDVAVGALDKVVTYFDFTMGIAKAEALRPLEYRAYADTFVDLSRILNDTNLFGLEDCVEALRYKITAGMKEATALTGVGEEVIAALRNKYLEAQLAAVTAEKANSPYKESLKAKAKFYERFHDRFKRSMEGEFDMELQAKMDLMKDKKVFELLNKGEQNAALNELNGIVASYTQLVSLVEEWMTMTGTGVGGMLSTNLTYNKGSFQIQNHTSITEGTAVRAKLNSILTGLNRYKERMRALSLDTWSTMSQFRTQIINEMGEARMQLQKLETINRELGVKRNAIEKWERTKEFLQRWVWDRGLLGGITGPLALHKMIADKGHKRWAAAIFSVAIVIGLAYEFGILWGLEQIVKALSRTPIIGGIFKRMKEFYDAVANLLSGKTILDGSNKPGGERAAEPIPDLNAWEILGLGTLAGIVFAPTIVIPFLTKVATPLISIVKKAGKAIGRGKEGSARGPGRPPGGKKLPEPRVPRVSRAIKNIVRGREAKNQFIVNKGIEELRRAVAMGIRIPEEYVKLLEA